MNNEIDYKICHLCGNMMPTYTGDRLFEVSCHGKTMVVSCNAKYYKCISCGEIVYSADEMKRIENEIKEGNYTLLEEKENE